MELLNLLTMHAEVVEEDCSYMGLKSTFSIVPNASVYWENNHASLGGAVYVQDASPISYCTSVAQYVPKEECFF